MINAIAEALGSYNPILTFQDEHVNVYLNSSTETSKFKKYILSFYEAARTPIMRQPSNPTKPKLKISNIKETITDQFLLFLSDLKIQEALARNEDMAPASLANKKSYNDEDVVKQLHTDQHSKCYLCERHLSTDFQVEHLKSQENFKELTYTWDNLFLACSYCNGKKKHLFDSDYSPLYNNVEEDIVPEINFKDKQVRFTSDKEATGIDITLGLLHRLYNGTNRFRSIKEERFYEEFIAKINHFQDLVTGYIEHKTERFKTAILEELELDKENLGFKYHILNSSILADEFREHLIWYKIA